jgi:hypothetical protein
MKDTLAGITGGIAGTALAVYIRRALEKLAQKRSRAPRRTNADLRRVS